MTRRRAAVTRELWTESTLPTEAMTALAAVMPTTEWTTAKARGRKKERKT